MKKRWKFWMAVAIPATMAAAVGMAYRPVVVNGTSMWPTLHHKQMVLMDKHDAGDLRRGDIVVFEVEGEMLIKRVYATGGDFVEVAQFRNGMRTLVATSGLSVSHMRQYAAARPWELRIFRMPVPQGFVYVLGDNYQESADSREFGPIPTDVIMGKVVTPDEAVRRLPSRFIAAFPRVHARQRSAR